MTPMIIPSFLTRCEAYATASGISRARLSTLLFNDGKRLDAVAAGSNIGVLTLERAEVLLGGLEKTLPEPVQ
jgi:hypothetical protein